jgi:UrcA family protein
LIGISSADHQFLILSIRQAFGDLNGVRRSCRSRRRAMHHFIFSLAAAALLAAPALAADPGARTAKVRHADLDLSTAQGRATLNRRIAAATEAVCGSYAGASVDEQDAIGRCRADARRQVAAQRIRNNVAAR